MEWIWKWPGNEATLYVHLHLYTLILGMWNLARVAGATFQVFPCKVFCGESLGRSSSMLRSGMGGDENLVLCGLICAVSDTALFKMFECKPTPTIL